MEEKQCCEKDLYENKQHGIQYGIHGIQNGDQEEFASLEFELERKGPTRPPDEHSTDARSVLTADSNHMSSPRPLQPLTCSDKSQNYILQSGNPPVPLRPPSGHPIQGPSILVAKKTFKHVCYSVLQQSIQEAQRQGGDISGFHSICLPVIKVQDRDGNVRWHNPIPFKTLRGLKNSCSQYGPTIPFTLVLLEGISTDALAPNDWKLFAKACLS